MDFQSRIDRAFGELEFSSQQRASSDLLNALNITHNLFYLAKKSAHVLRLSKEKQYLQ